MVWIFLVLLLIFPKDVSSVIKIADKEYKIVQAFGGDILDARYRIHLVNELEDAEVYGVILKDFEPKKHLERLQDLDITNNLSSIELELLGEKILIEFIRYLTDNRFDVGLYGEAGVTFADRGVVSFALVGDRIAYSDTLFYQLPLNDLPHIDWEQRFEYERKLLYNQISQGELIEYSSPFRKLTLFALESFPNNNQVGFAGDFRASLAKAGFSGTKLDVAWQRLEEIALRVFRQRLKK